MRNPFLGLYIRCCDGLRRKLEHLCFLTFQQSSQHYQLPIGKFQGIMMCSRVVLVDLPKDGRRVFDYLPSPIECATMSVTAYRSGEGEFCPRKNANRRVAILRRSKPSRAGIEVSGSQFLANFGRT
jgi:hypothetical protein